jgi:hypothetical protein
MTLSSLSYIYMVFVDTHQGSNGSHLTTNKAYVEFIGVKTTHTYLQDICCKVKQWIKES